MMEGISLAEILCCTFFFFFKSNRFCYGAPGRELGKEKGINVVCI